jgi:modulator of FtsH protease HflC
MNRKIVTLVIGAMLLLIASLLLFVFQVRQTDVAIVTTFGKPTRPITEAGAHFKLPWPIQKVWTFDHRVQNFDDELLEGITADSFNILASVYVGWKITDPQAFFPKFAGSSQPTIEAERVLKRLVANAQSAVIGKHPLGDFLSPEDGSNKFEEIEKEILAALQTQVHAQNYGLEIKFLGIKRLGLPESVTQSVFERMTSERQVLASRSQSQGVAEAQTIHPDADRKAMEILSAADSQALQIKAKGEAAAAESLPVFQRKPELAVFIFRLNALENSLKDRSTLIFDQNTPPFDLFRGISTNLFTK